MSFLSRSALVGTAVACAMLTQSETADAVPSFARQTGYYCSTCHTTQPELTPFGRQFKLNGYTAGGTRCGDIRKVFGNADSSTEWSGANFSGFVLPTFYHFEKDLLTPPGPGSATNDIANPLGAAAVFYGGQAYCNLGVFFEFGYSSSPTPANISLGNATLRYSDTARVEGHDVVWGVMGNNNPTQQDVWNSVPVWAFPWVPEALLPGPSWTTMIEGTFNGRAGSAGAYVWVDNTVYVELSAYRAFDSKILKAVGGNPNDGTPRFDGLAPYWRVAVEKTWNHNSLMVGTYGMYADVTPTISDGSRLAYPGYSNKFTDVAVDAEYQYIDEINAFTARAYYIWENQKLDASYFGSGGADAVRTSQDLTSFNASATYTYNRHVSLSGGYFNLQGTSDSLYWDLSTGKAKPNSEGLTLDLAYMPYPYGGPDMWPWLNARIGVTYTHYSKFDGTSLNASDNDTTFLYAWVDF